MFLHYTGLFFNELVLLFIEMAPYLMLGVLIAGLMHVFLSKDFVAKHIGGNSISSVIKAAVFGVPLPLCSCGVVPTAVYLKNSGGSKPAVMSFLISTPQTGIDSITATYGMLGPLFAVFRALAALVMGIAGGIVDSLLDRKDNKNRAVTPKQKIVSTVPVAGREFNGFFPRIKEMLRYALFELLDEITVNFIIGLAIAALIAIIIPDDLFTGSFLSNKLISMILMVIIGIPMYICSTASIPIAVALIAKGVSPGAAYVFLVAGPATNAASLAIISKSLGKKGAVRYVATIIAGSLIFGFLMDTIFNRIGISPAANAMNHSHNETGPTPFMIAVAIIFFAILIMLFIRRARTAISSRKQKSKTDSQNYEEDSVMTRINIEGMDCGHCAESVKKALSLVNGIDKIEVDLNGKCAYVEGNFSLLDAAKAVNNAGYEVV